MKNSHISWTNHTFNPWIGCTKVSPGCLNCYAETRDKRFHRGIHWGVGASRVRTKPSNWNDPVRWNKEAEEAAKLHESECLRDPAYGMHVKPPERPRVFCASLSDWLDDEIAIDWLADLLRLIKATPYLNWLLLSKRPELWQSRLVKAKLHIQGAGGHDTHPDAVWILDWLTGHPPKNVWVGTTVEDQTRGNERVPALLSIPAEIRFLSMEPLLGPVDLHLTDVSMKDDRKWHKMIHWVIVGGESGTHARVMHPQWVYDLRDQCEAHKVAFHFKQWGEWAPVTPDMNQDVKELFVFPDTTIMFRAGKIAAGRMLEGRAFDELPV